MRVPRFEEGAIRFDTVTLSVFRLYRAGMIRPGDLQHMTLDDVDLMHLYLDAVDEASIDENNR